MRKKSHISLARYIVNSEGMEDLKRYKGSFYTGSVLPDCLPSFLVRKHTIEDSFTVLEKEMKKLVSHYDREEGVNRYFCIHLGMIIHYISDYFTYPHNSNYPGKLKDHCIYEEELKKEIRSYVKSPEAVQKRMGKTVYEPDAILVFVQRMHQIYSDSRSAVRRDCEYIVCMCHTIVDAILILFETMQDAATHTVAC